MPADRKVRLLLTDDERSSLVGAIGLARNPAEADIFVDRIEDVLLRYRSEPMDTDWMKGRRKVLALVGTLSASLAEQLRVIGEWDDEGILSFQGSYDKLKPIGGPTLWWGDERVDLVERLARLSEAAQDARRDFSTPSVRAHREDIADLVRWLLEVVQSHYHKRLHGRGATYQSDVKEILAVCLPAAGVLGGPSEERFWRDYVAPEIKSLRSWAKFHDK